MKDTEFEIFHGDTLLNEWDILRELNPAKKPLFDAIVANPPFSYPRDGAAFLAALPIAYSGSYCRARLISDSTRGHRERGRLGDAETALPEAGRR